MDHRIMKIKNQAEIEDAAVVDMPSSQGVVFQSATPTVTDSLMMRYSLQGRKPSYMKRVKTYETRER